MQSQILFQKYEKMLLVYKVHKSVLFGSRISKLIQKSLNALESIVKKWKSLYSHGFTLKATHKEG